MKYKKAIRKIKNYYKAQFTELKSELARKEILHQQEKIPLGDLEQKIKDLEAKITVQSQEIERKNFEIEQLQKDQECVKDTEVYANR